MKKTLLSVATALALAGAMMFPMNMLARASASPGAPAGQGGRREGRERHPEIRAAMNHLRMAKQNLEKANKDYGGHRVKALEHTNQALEECQKAFESDEK